jgi:hypothetical protein
MTREELRKVTVKILREIAATEAFVGRADLKEALKTRLAGLRIPYNLDTVEEACDRLDVDEHRRAAGRREGPWTRR